MDLGSLGDLHDSFGSLLERRGLAAGEDDASCAGGGLGEGDFLCYFWGERHGDMEERKVYVLRERETSMVFTRMK